MESDQRVITHLGFSLAASLTLFSLLLLSITANGADKLFASHEKLNVSVSGPFKTLYRQRTAGKVFSGQLTYTDSHATGVELDVEIEARGHFRRSKKNCANPPLKIILDKDKNKSSLFAGLKDVKVVVPCKNSKQYEQLVILEYLIYRMYNQLTPQGYRVRLMEITLLDEPDKKKSWSRTFPGFFIEPHRRIAKRMGKTKINENSVPRNQLEAETLAMLSLFQYMIGNTDYSPRVSPGDDNCCHNVKLYRGKDDFHAYAVPYDFDFSGLVNAPYAIPTPKAEIRNVRTRRYWGYCEHNEIVRNMVPHFMQVRESIEALVSSSELSKRSKGRASKYLKAFFETVSDPKKLEKRVLRDCR